MDFGECDAKFGPAEKSKVFVIHTIEGFYPDGAVKNFAELSPLKKK